MATKLLGQRILSLSSLVAQTSEMRDNRCSKCHRYKKDPPTPELGHEGCHAESKCKLDHHPAPCDYVDDAGNACVPIDNPASDDAVSKEIEGKISAQSLELDQLRAEMLEMRRMVGSMRLSAPSSASLATSTTQFGTVTTTTHSGPRMSLLQPPMSSLGAGASSLSTVELAAAAQQLINVNGNGVSVGSNLGDYAGPNMKELQQDSAIANEVQRQLAALIAGTPALQKVVAGQLQGKAVPAPVPQHSQQTVQQLRGVQTLGNPHPAFQAIQSGAAGITSVPQRDDCNLLDMDSLLGLTVRDKQYRPHEFATKGNFFYAKNINDRNITLPLYVYGYLKHCIILSSGLVPVQEGEVMARLVHLMNIMEITSNNSTLNDFDHAAWQLGRGYGDRVFNDIQQGLRSWTEMPNHILPDVFLHVKDMVDIQTRKKDTNSRGGGGGGAGRGGGRGRGSSREKNSDRAGSDGKPLVCTTYNDFFTGSGCAYEFNNQRKCNYEHYCSKCFASTGNKICHKSRFCGDAASVAVSTSG